MKQQDTMKQDMMTTTLTRTVAGCLLAALLVIPATGCEESWYDPRVFDDLKDETWVDSSEVPGDFDSRIYGIAMAAGGAGSDGSSFFVAGRNEDGFANLRFDSNGDREEAVVQLNGISNTPPFNTLPDKPLMVANPGAQQVAVALNAGGTPEAPERTVITMFDTAAGGVLETPRFDVLGFGTTTGLGFGDTEVAGTASAVIVDDAFLTVVRDIANPADAPVCNHEASRGFGMAVGDIVDSDGGGDGVDGGIAEIAMGATGEVVILAATVVSDAAATVVNPGDPPAVCFDLAATPVRAPLLTLTAPGDAGATFGTTVLAGDINGAGLLVLVVTAPGANKVFVYLDLDPAVLDPTPITIDGPAGSREFGDSVAIADLGGQGRTELIIAAPGTNVGEDTAAGSVFVFQLGDGATSFDLALQLHDAQPEADQRFGQSFTVAPFGGDRQILVVGADQEVFTYFRTRADDSDVRANR